MEIPRARIVLALIAALAVGGGIAAAVMAGRGGGEAEVRRARTETAAPRPEHLVLVVLDTTRADAMGYAGYRRDTTPNLDALAEESIVFDRAYSHAPWTIPSVASLFTSMTPVQHGISQWNQVLDEALLTLPEVLQQAGFSTRAVVSHHAFKPRFQFQQGFEHFDWSLIADEKAYDYAHAKSVTRLGLQAVDDARAEGRPSLVWLHYFDAHTKYLHHPEHDFGDKRRDLYDSELAFQDAAVGELIDGLRSRGALDDTALVILSDHGEEFLDHGGLKHTSTLYEELVRVPMLARLPGFAPGRVAAVAPTMDLAPTLLALLGVPVPEEFQGVPMTIAPGEAGWTLLPAPDRPVYLETLRRKQRQGLVRGDLKVIHDLEADTWELYDLRRDPRERINLAEDRPDALAALRAELDRIRSGERAAAPEVPLGAEMRERLQALGYVE